MNPASTLRLRRITGLLGAAWALLAIGLSVSALLSPRSDLALPVNCSFVAGVAVVQWSGPNALAAGVARGDRIRSIDGMPMVRVIKAALPWLAILFVFLIMVTYIPWLSTYIPTALMGPEIITN